MVNKKIILQLALATIIAMPLVAVVLDRIFDSVDLAAMLAGAQTWWIQLLAGIGAGLVIAFIAQLIINMPFMQKVNIRYSNMLGRFQLTWSEILFISVCAGIGEELLFRGGVQPLLGVIPTALVFVAIHGYLNPKDWRISLYGLYMTIAIIGIGYLAEKCGLVSAMIAHTIIDVYLLHKLQDAVGEIDITENAEITDPYPDDEMDNN